MTTSKVDGHEPFPLGPLMLQATSQWQHNGEIGEWSSVFFNGKESPTTSVDYVSPYSFMKAPYYMGYVTVPERDLADFLTRYPDFKLTYLSESRHDEVVKVPLPDNDFPTWFVEAMGYSETLHHAYWKDFDNTIVDVGIVENIRPAKTVRYMDMYTPKFHSYIYTGVQVTETWPCGRVEVLKDEVCSYYCKTETPLPEDYPAALQSEKDHVERFLVRRDERPNAKINIKIVKDEKIK